MRALLAPQGAGFDAARNVGVDSKSVVGEHIVEIVVKEYTAVAVETDEIHSNAAHECFFGDGFPFAVALTAPPCFDGSVLLGKFVGGRLLEKQS